MTKKQSYLRCITRKHNKRGSGRDIVLMAVLLFVFAISALIMRYTTSHVVEIFYNSSDFNSSYNQSNYDITQMMKDSTDQTGGQLDYVILAIFIGLILGIVVTSWYIGGHPIFLFFFLPLNHSGLFHKLNTLNFHTLINQNTFSNYVYDFSFFHLTNSIKRIFSTS